MTNYGVPTEVDGALPWAWAQERLLANRNFWFVTVRPDGRPHSMPVWGVWMVDEQVFRFSTDREAFKVRHLATNPHVCVTSDSTIEVVSIEGSARLINDSETIRETALAWARKYEAETGDDVEATVEFFSKGAVVEVTPIRAIGIIERDEEFAAKATRWVW
jgi:PPOX class probable F420-dependent enzyme